MESEEPRKVDRRSRRISGLSVIVQAAIIAMPTLTMDQMSVSDMASERSVSRNKGRKEGSSDNPVSRV